MKLIACSINQSFYAPILAFVMALSFMSFQNSATTMLDDSCPTASFSVQNNLCGSSCNIIFNNESTGGINYVWDFGDGNFSTEKNPTHSYNRTSTFQVKLTVIGATCTSEFIGTVDVIGI